MELLVDTYGVAIGKTSERVVVKQKNTILEEIPFFQLKQITILNKGISFSSDVVEECMLHGIPINFLNYQGMPYANLISPNLNGTVQTRRQQLLAYTDQRSVFLGKAFVKGKLQNQANLLKYFAKYRKVKNMAEYDFLREKVAAIEKNIMELNEVCGNNIDEARGYLLSIEGRGAQTYWDAVINLLKGKVDFSGRLHQGAQDPVNSLMNYGYGILKTRILAAICLAGLDPFGGFLHADRSGRISLVFDLIEEFRQPVVDRVVIGMVNKGMKLEMEEDMLSQSLKKDLAFRINERLESTEKYEGRKHAIKHILVRQARRMASFVRGDGSYNPFISGW